RETPQPLDEPDQLPRRGELLVIPRGRDCLALRDVAHSGDLGVDLAAGQHTTVSGFRALGQLHLDTLHRRQGGLLRELVRIEPTIVRAATEVPGTELPDEVTTVPQVIVGNGALSGVVREPALGCATVER